MANKNQQTPDARLVTQMHNFLSDNGKFWKSQSFYLKCNPMHVLYLYESLFSLCTGTCVPYFMPSSQSMYNRFEHIIGNVIFYSKICKN